MVRKRYNCPSYYFCLKNFILAAMRKQKLFGKRNSVLFIDSTSIKVSPDTNRSRNTQEHSIGDSKGVNNEVAFMLYSIMSNSFSFVSC